MAIPMKTIPGYFNSKPGIQVGTKMEGPIYKDERGRIHVDMQGVRFLQQMGVEWVMIAWPATSCTTCPTSRWAWKTATA